MAVTTAYTRRVARAVFGLFAGHKTVHAAGGNDLLMHLPPYARGSYMRTTGI